MEPAVPPAWTAQEATDTGEQQSSFRLPRLARAADPRPVACDEHRTDFRLPSADRSRDKYADKLFDAYVFIEDSDAPHTQYAARGVEFTRTLGDMPSGICSNIVGHRQVVQNIGRGRALVW
jgi:hypothetical protein